MTIGNLLAEAGKIYANRGAEQLSIKLLEYVYWRSVETIQSLSDRYWNYNGGKQKYAIGDYSIYFDSHTQKGGGAVRKRMRIEHDMLEDVVNSLNKDDVFLILGQILEHIRLLRPKFVLILSRLSLIHQTTNSYRITCHTTLVTLRRIN